MGLNEKLAARRKELEFEALKNKESEEMMRREHKAQKEAELHAEKIAIQAEVNRRLAEKGIKNLPMVSETKVQAAFSNALDHAARERMTSVEKAVFWGFVLMSAIFAINSSLFGFVFFGAGAWIYSSLMKGEYRKQILAEGKANADMNGVADAATVQSSKVNDVSTADVQK